MTTRSERTYSKSFNELAVLAGSAAVILASFNVEETAPPEQVLPITRDHSRAIDTRPSNVVSLYGPQERVIGRLRMLRTLPANHDNEGASAPDHASVDRAIAFISGIKSFYSFNATLNDDGAAVVEFEDRSTGFFGDVTFEKGGLVECYCRRSGAPSEYVEGDLNAKHVQEFLESSMRVVL